MDKKEKNVFADFNRFSASLTHVSYMAGNFARSLQDGNWVLGPLVSGLENATSALTNFATAAFEEASRLEVSRIAMGGTLKNAFDDKISFKQGLLMGDNVRESLVTMAADSLGETSDYTKVAAGINDSLAEFNKQLGGTTEQMISRFQTMAPNFVKSVVLNTKVYGDQVPTSSVIRTFTKLLDTGKAPVREIFLMNNAGLRAAIAEDEKKNGKLSLANLAARGLRLQKIFEKSISPEQIAMLDNAITTKFGATKSALVGIDDGVFGMSRKLGKDKDEQPITIFTRLADLAKPFLDALTTGAKSITAFSDPLLVLSDLIVTKLQPIADDLSAKLARFLQQFSFAPGDLQGKLSEAFEATFGFKFQDFKLSEKITAFFDGIANWFDGLGAVSLTGNAELDKILTSIGDGITKMIGAMFNAAMRQAMKDPVQTIKIAFVLNPVAFLTLGILVLSLVSAFGPLLLVVGSFAGGLGFIAIAIVGSVVAITAFSTQFKQFGQSLMNSSLLTFQFLGGVFTLLGGVGTDLKKAWDQLTKGDILGLAGSLGSAFLKLLASVGLLVVTPFVGIADIFKVLADSFIALVLNPIEDFLRKILWLEPVNRAPAVPAAPAYKRPSAYQVPISTPLPGFASGNALGNLLVGYQRERLAAPQGAQVVFANSSEAIIPGNRISAFQNNNTTGGNTISMTINNYSGEDIVGKVRMALEELLG